MCIFPVATAGVSCRDRCSEHEQILPGQSNVLHGASYEKATLIPQTLLPLFPRFPERALEMPFEPLGHSFEHPQYQQILILMSVLKWPKVTGSQASG